MKNKTEEDGGKDGGKWTWGLRGKVANLHENTSEQF